MLGWVYAVEQGGSLENCLVNASEKYTMISIMGTAIQDHQIGYYINSLLAMLPLPSTLSESTTITSSESTTSTSDTPPDNSLSSGAKIAISCVSIVCFCITIVAVIIIIRRKRGQKDDSVVNENILI